MITQDDFTRIKNDANGNPRYVCHFLNFCTAKDDDVKPWDISAKYELALSRARKMGGRKFHNKQYGGGVVFQCYELRTLCEDINKAMKAIEKA